MPFLRVVFILILGCLVACGSTDELTRPGSPATDPLSPPPPPPPPPGSAGAVSIRLESAPALPTFVGQRVWIHVLAFDANRGKVDSREAAALSENPLVASVESKTVFEVRQSGTATSDAWFSLRLQSPGTTTIRVSLGDTTENLVLEAVDLPPATTSVIVESFAVLEYRAQCAWACPYLAYAPLLRLREATGNAAVEVVGLRVDVPGLTSGLCRGTIPIGPGEAQDVNRLDWYLWNNDVFFVKLDGTPIPDGPVTARAIVRSSAGEYGRIDVTGAIARGIQNPALPAQIPGQYWTC